LRSLASAAVSRPSVEFVQLSRRYENDQLTAHTRRSPRDDNDLCRSLNAIAPKSGNLHELSVTNLIFKERVRPRPIDSVLRKKMFFDSSGTACTQIEQPKIDDPK
jgi:hypothetical protein